MSNDKIMKILLGVLLAALVACTGTTDTKSMNVDAKQAQFQVTLPSNPTTGYQWTVKEYDKSLLQLVGSQYSAGQTKLIGAGGNMVFTFKLASEQALPLNTKIVFIYARPWESGKGALKTVTVHFR